MIASLRGTLIDVGAGTCVIEANGVGYAVHLSSHATASLPAKGQEVFVRTRQVVREDAHLLFGFADADELRCFDLMVSVSGVGPKLALAVLSGLRPAALARAIREEHVGALVAVPGIGRKTAERLVVELRDKLEGLPVAAAVAPAPKTTGPRGVLPRSERYDDAVAALVRLGYTAPQAQEVVRQASEGVDEASAEDLVRRSLAMLGKAAVTR
jgi:holliday junction DNA helicase RuvA